MHNAIDDSLLVLCANTVLRLLYIKLDGLLCSVLCVLSCMTYILVLVGLSFVMYVAMTYNVLYATHNLPNDVLYIPNLTYPAVCCVLYDLSILCCVLYDLTHIMLCTV